MEAKGRLWGDLRGAGRPHWGKPLHRRAPFNEIWKPKIRADGPVRGTVRAQRRRRLKGERRFVHVGTVIGERDALSNRVRGRARTQVGASRDPMRNDRLPNCRSQLSDYPGFPPMVSTMFRRYGLVLLVAGLLGTGCDLVSSSESADRPSPPPDPVEIDSLVQDRLDTQPDGTGLVVGIVDDGERRTFTRGVRREGGPSVSAQTLFEIASVTKTVTALVLADRIEAGTVQRSTPASALLPDSVDVPTGDGPSIDLGSLAAHTAGLPRLPPNFGERSASEDPADPYAGYTVADLYEGIEQTRLDHQPGRTYSYSNFGYGVLGHVLARRADVTFEALVVERVASPLSMADTRVDLSEAQARRLATGHNSEGEAVSHWHFRESMAGAGALRSSLRDVMTYVAAQLGQADAPASLRRAIDRSQTILHERSAERALAYGWHVRNRTDDPVFWHNGATSGFRSFVGFSPEDEAGIAVLANVNQPLRDLGLRMLDLAIAHEEEDS